MSNDWRSAALMECHILVDELAVHVKKEDSTVNISGNLHAYVDSLNQNVKLVYEDDYDKIEIVMRRTQLVSSVERVIQYAMENASEGIFIGPLDNTVSTYCTYRVDEVWYTDSSVEALFVVFSGQVGNPIMMISMNEMGSTLRHKTSQSGMVISIDWVSANRFFSLLQQSEELVSFSEEGIPYIEEHIIVGTTLRNPQEQFEAFVTFQDEIRDPEWFFGKRYNDYVLLLRRNLNLPLPNFSLYSYDKNRTYLEHRMREELQLLSSSDFNLPRFLGVAGKNAFIEENLAVGLPMLTVISLDSKSTIFSETYIPVAFRLLDANQFLYHKPSTLSVMSAHSPEQYSELTQFLSFDAKRDKILVFQEYLADLSTNTSIETGKFVAIEIR